MGVWSIRERQSDYGLDLLGTIVATQLKAVNFSTFNVIDVSEVIKHFLFANTPSGAESSTFIFFLIQTATENGLDPYHYLMWPLSCTVEMESGLTNRCAAPAALEHSPPCRA